MDVLMREIIIHIAEKGIVNYTVWQDFLHELKDNDGSYLVKVEPRKKRSLSQNSYYWGVVIPIVKDGLRDAGYDDVKTGEDVHLILKTLFLKKHIPNHKTGEFIEVPGNTSGLTTKEFNEFIESVGKWGAEYLGIALPAPGQQSFLKLQ